MGFTPPIAKTVHHGPAVWGQIVMHESGLLGALMHDMTLMPRVVDIVAAEDFSTSLHSRLFEALVRSKQTSGAVHRSSIAEKLGVYVMDADGGCEMLLAQLESARAKPSEATALALEIATAGKFRRSRPEPIDEDVVAWSHRQADLLSRLATRDDEVSLSVDWGSVIEEVLHVGRSQTRGVERKMVRIFEHLLKALSDPDAPSRSRWRIEVDAWTARLKSEATPSMRQIIDLDVAWSQGRADAEADLTEYGVKLPKDIPNTCPFSFDELTCGTTMGELLAKLVVAIPSLQMQSREGQ